MDTPNTTQHTHQQQHEAQSAAWEVYSTRDTHEGGFSLERSLANARSGGARGMNETGGGGADDIIRWLLAWAIMSHDVIVSDGDTPRPNQNAQCGLSASCTRQSTHDNVLHDWDNAVWSRASRSDEKLLNRELECINLRSQLGELIDCDRA